MVVREVCDSPSNWRSTATFDSYLRDHDIPAISGIDTRAVTRHIREAGDMRAALVRNASGLSDEDLIQRARIAPLPGERDVVGEVISDEIQVFGADGSPHVVVVDCGVKINIVESLVRRGARVTIVPYGTPFADVAALRPDGVIVSPGPGDPANLDEGLEVVERVIEERIPYFGICLGHQLLARSIGAETGKLKFGHRGGNHPVIDLDSRRVSITSQNHGFYVDGRSMPEDTPWRVSLVNLNDGTVEGLRNVEQPVLSVQFHPEASPGPWDSGVMFDEFLAMIEGRKHG
jgi:carbamoyl-phosphate synthase small subunit